MKGKEEAKGELDYFVLANLTILTPSGKLASSVSHKNYNGQQTRRWTEAI